MDVFKDIDTVFHEYQVDLNIENNIRQRLKSICKKPKQLSREISSVMHAIHTSDEQIKPVCIQARKMLIQAREYYQILKEAVSSIEYFKYNDHWRTMNEDYCYHIGLLVFLEEGVLVEHQTIGEMLDISIDECDNTFHMDIEDYLIGLLNVCTELTRMAVNCVSRSDFVRPFLIYKYVLDLDAGFRLLNLKNDHLRKRFDALKYDVKKVREVVYDIESRKLGKAPWMEGKTKLEMGKGVKVKLGPELGVPLVVNSDSEVGSDPEEVKVAVANTTA